MVKKSFPNHATYVATKFAASEIGWNEWVVTICFGAFETTLLSMQLMIKLKNNMILWKCL